MFRDELFEFIEGTSPNLLVGRDWYYHKSGKESHLAGFWLLYGKGLLLLQKCGIWVAHLSTSSCAAERSFSVQSDTYTPKRNQLLSEKVKKLVYCR